MTNASSPSAGETEHRELADPNLRVQAVEVRSAEQEVHAALRRQIIEELPPGTPLPLAQLAERFSVSTMPVRVALRQLQAEGLVEQRPRRGSVVAALTSADFIDLYTVRMALEGIAARSGAAMLGDSDIESMRATFGELSELRLDDADIIDHYLPLDLALHDACYRVCEHPRLLSLIESYRRQSERYFRLYLRDRLNLPGDIERQRRFLAACERRQPEEAEAAIRALFEWTMHHVLAGGM
jgi:DNA-binding GntR family transcriptional regulator